MNTHNIITSSKLTTLLSLALSAALGFLALPTTGHAAVLTGSVSRASGNVDLTADGTLGWVKYGFATFPYYVQKSGFSDFSGGIGAFNSGPVPVGVLDFSWTDGGAFQPTGTNTTWGYYIADFSFNLTTTSASPQKLNFYYWSDASDHTFTATLGAQTYTVSNFVSGNVNFELNFTPDSIGQTLAMSVTGGSGQRAAYGASLAVVPEPSTGLLLGLGLGALAVLKNRRRLKVS